MYYSSSSVEAASATDWVPDSEESSLLEAFLEDCTLDLRLDLEESPLESVLEEASRATTAGGPMGGCRSIEGGASNTTLTHLLGKRPSSTLPSGKSTLPFQTPSLFTSKTWISSPTRKSK
jgi:hypothetical protein